MQPGREEVTALRLLGQSPRKQWEHARIFHFGAVSSVLLAHWETIPRALLFPHAATTLHCSLYPVHIQLPVRPETATSALCLLR